MGQDKAFLKFKGKMLIEYPLELLGNICDEVVISGSDERLSSFNLPLIPDEVASTGPIGGIYSSLKKVSNKYALVLSCDLPFVNQDILNFLLENLDEKYEIVCPLNENEKPEPMSSIYSIEILNIMREQLRLENYKIQDLFSRLKTRYVKLPFSSDQLKKHFSNINSIDDYQSLLDE